MEIDLAEMESFVDVRLATPGPTRGPGSVLMLMPEYDICHFCSSNSERLGTTACGIVGALRQRFLDRFFTSLPSSLFR